MNIFIFIVRTIGHKAMIINWAARFINSYCNHADSTNGLMQQLTIYNDIW
jgi:hypothetical protein